MDFVEPLLIEPDLITLCEVEHLVIILISLKVTVYEDNVDPSFHVAQLKPT